MQTTRFAFGFEDAPPEVRKVIDGCAPAGFVCLLKMHASQLVGPNHAWAHFPVSPADDIGWAVAGAFDAIAAFLRAAEDAEHDVVTLVFINFAPNRIEGIGGATQSGVAPSLLQGLLAFSDFVAGSFKTPASCGWAMLKTERDGTSD